MWGDTILILIISLVTAFFGEGVTWFMVYRTEKYQKLKQEVERQCKKFHTDPTGFALKYKPTNGQFVLEPEI